MKLTAFVFACLAVPGLVTAETTTFKPTSGVSTFAVRPPVLRAKPR